MVAQNIEDLFDIKIRLADRAKQFYLDSKINTKITEMHEQDNVS